MKPRPPRIARALLRLLLPSDDQRFVLGDLDEAFERQLGKEGERAARRWYRRQVTGAILPLVKSGVGTVLSGLPREVRQTVRQLARRPQYAGGMTGTMALGLASAITLGGIAWNVWLQPLPFPDSERLVRVWERSPVDSIGERVRYPISPPLLRELQERDWAHYTGFAGILRSTPEWVVGDRVTQLSGVSVSHRFFEILGVEPLLGRADWSSASGEEVAEVVLTEPFWRQAFGGDPGVIGRSMDLAGVQHSIVGVVPAFSGYPEAADLAVPLHFEPRQLGEGMRGARYIQVVARVRPGSSIATGSEEFSGFIDRLGSDWASHEGWSGEAVSLRSDLVGPFRSVLRLLLGAGAVFLALAIVNVLGLGAARALDRRGETAIRVALGASSLRRLRGAVVEGALLGAIGGAAALLIGNVLLSAASGWLPHDLPRTESLTLSAGETVLLLGLATGLGIAVVAFADRLVPPGSLRSTNRRTTSRQNGRRGLVVGQFAFTTLLLGAGAVALERSTALANHDLGFQPDGLWTGLVALPRTTNSGLEERVQSWRSLLVDLEARGLQAAISTNAPMTGSNSNYTFRRADRETGQSSAQYAIVSPDYFEMMAIPVRGRVFRDGDAGPVTIISEELAARHFPGENPVGRSLVILQEEYEIVGVAGSTAHFGPASPEPPMLYVPYEHVNWQFATLLVGGEGALGAEVAAAMGRTVPGATPPDGSTYETHLAQWFRPLRIQVGIVGALALVGSLLAALGLYSTVAFQLRGRVRELGIRVALGATRMGIVRRVVRGAVAWAGSGLVIGFGLWWLARGAIGAALGMEQVVFSPTSVVATAFVVLALTMVAVAAPARRAASADPLRSFRAN